MIFLIVGGVVALKIAILYPVTKTFGFRGRADATLFALSYGGATRLDLLEKAGARTAKLLVVAVDEPETAMRILTEARKHFRNPKVIARAYSRTDAFEYSNLGVPAMRETFGSALDSLAYPAQPMPRARMPMQETAT